MQHKYVQVLPTNGYISESPCHKSDNFSAPLGSLTNGRLIFAAGAIGVTFYGDPLLPDLYRAHFADIPPSITVQSGIVTIHYEQTPSRNHPVWRHETLAAIALNGTIPWEIECRGGLAGLMADLRELPLRALDLGSISGAVLALPKPLGPVFIYLAGSVSDVALYRPPNVAVRIQINGSASHLTFDEQHYRALNDGIRWQSPDYQHGAACYEISIAGSASNMKITTW